MKENNYHQSEVIYKETLSPKKVQFGGEDLVGLTKNQKEVLDMLRNDLETPRKVAYRRKTSLRAVYKTISILKKKGYLKGRFDRGVQFSETTTQKRFKRFNFPVELPNMKLIRLHNQHFVTKILQKTGIYDRTRHQSKWMQVDGNRIELNLHNIEIYCSKDRHFYGRTAKEALEKSMVYWEGLFTQLENKLGILIQKGNNIRQVNAHYAEVDNELARDVRERQEKLILTAPEDGKAYALVDCSLSRPEFEAVHPQTAYRDMEGAIKPFFDDLRGYVARTGEPIRLSDMMKLFSVYAENIKSHIGAIQTLGSKVGELVDKVDQMNSIYMKLNGVKQDDK